MKTVSIRSTKPDKKIPATRQQPPESPAQPLRASTPSPFEDTHALIAQRAYDLYSERGYRHGFALDDWLEAEREILSQIPPV